MTKLAASPFHFLRPRFTSLPLPIGGGTRALPGGSSSDLALGDSMDEEMPAWDYVWYEHAGLKLLIPECTRATPRESGVLARGVGPFRVLLSALIVTDSEKAARLSQLLHGPVVSGGSATVRLIREGPVEFPFPGWERVRQDQYLGGGPGYFWGLMFYFDGLAIQVNISGGGVFDTTTERGWARVIQSISVDMSKVPAFSPVHHRRVLAPEELRRRNARGVQQVLRRVRNAREMQEGIYSPRLGCIPAGILHKLDVCAQASAFPNLDHGYIYLADTRLSAYGNRKCWAVIIEILGYNPRATGCEGFADALYCFGNCLKGQPPSLSDVGSVYTISDGPNGPLFGQGNDLNTDAESLRIRDIVVPINRDPVFLASKRVGPRFDAPHLKAYAMRQKEPLRKNLLDAARRMEDAGGADEFRGQDLLRSLVPEHRNLLLATDDELSQRLSMELPLLLRLDAWHHPDISAGELPSESEAFKMIAEVLATGDASRYKPRRKPNTHWSNWPMGGDL
jgi:hypothetical protein